MAYYTAGDGDAFDDADVPMERGYAAPDVYSGMALEWAGGGTKRRVAETDFAVDERPGNIKFAREDDTLAVYGAHGGGGGGSGSKEEYRGDEMGYEDVAASINALQHVPYPTNASFATGTISSAAFLAPSHGREGGSYIPDPYTSYGLEITETKGLDEPHETSATVRGQFSFTFYDPSLTPGTDSVAKFARGDHGGPLFVVSNAAPGLHLLQGGIEKFEFLGLAGVNHLLARHYAVAGNVLALHDPANLPAGATFDGIEANIATYYDITHNYPVSVLLACAVKYFPKASVDLAARSNDFNVACIAANIPTAAEAIAVSNTADAAVAAAADAAPLGARRIAPLALDNVMNARAWNAAAAWTAASARGVYGSIAAAYEYLRVKSLCVTAASRIRTALKFVGIIDQEMTRDGRTGVANSSAMDRTMGVVVRGLHEGCIIDFDAKCAQERVGFYVHLFPAADVLGSAGHGIGDDAAINALTAGRAYIPQLVGSVRYRARHVRRRAPHAHDTNYLTLYFIPIGIKKGDARGELEDCSDGRGELAQRPIFSDEAFGARDRLAGIKYELHVWPN